MNILYYHQHFSTPKGATGTRSYEFAQKLIKQGHKVTIVCGSYWIAETGLTGVFIRGQRRGIVDGINIIELEPNILIQTIFGGHLSFLRYSLLGINIALKEKYDILFATSTPLTAGIPGIFAKT